MKRPLIRSLAVLALLVGLATPASAGGPPLPPPNEFGYSSLPLQANGTYTPLFLDCGGSHILWYAPGPAPDYLWSGVTVSGGQLVPTTSTPLSINGTYQPLVGNFEADIPTEPYCDDILWYGPGTAPDYLWALDPGDPGDPFVVTSTPSPVNGTYQPVVVPTVAHGAGDGGDAIFWVQGGPGQEYLWVAEPSGGFTKLNGPSVNGVYDKIDRAARTGVLFRRDNGTDFLWEAITDGGAVTGSIPVNIDAGPVAIDQGDLGLLLYQPGPGGDLLVNGTNPDGTPTGLAGQINGTYTVGLMSPGTSSEGLVLWHRPGPGTDYIWAYNPT